MAYSAVKRARDWFRIKTSKLRADGTTGGDRFVIHDKPTEDTFADLLKTVAMTTEEADRARISASGALQNEQGLVVLASDAQSKANTVQLTDRSLVTQPHQLPTIIPATNDFTTTTVAADGVVTSTKDILDIVIDSGITTRNNFKINLKATFVKWLLRRVLPAGGSTGQIIKKLDGVDYNYGWASESVGGGGDTYRSTSTNSYPLTKGSKTFTIILSGIGTIAYAIGNRARFTSNANSANYLEGIITAWNGTNSLTVLVDNFGGTGGPYSDWNINLGGDIPSSDSTTLPALYVSSSNGNDTTGDGSPTKPFLTISKAQSVVITGQTIIIYGGTYSNSINISKTSISYTLFCFPGVTINQSITSFYDNTSTSSVVDIFGSPDIICNAGLSTTPLFNIFISSTKAHYWKLRNIRCGNIGGSVGYLMKITSADSTSNPGVINLSCSTAGGNAPYTVYIDGGNVSGSIKGTFYNYQTTTFDLIKLGGTLTYCCYGLTFENCSFLGRATTTLNATTFNLVKFNTSPFIAANFLSCISRIALNSNTAIGFDITGMGDLRTKVLINNGSYYGLVDPGNPANIALLNLIKGGTTDIISIGGVVNTNRGASNPWNGTNGNDYPLKGGTIVVDTRYTPQGTITGATNATPIVITAVAHGLTSGDRIKNVGVIGNAGANSLAYITVLSADTFSMYSDVPRTVGIAGTGGYTSGGIVNKVIITNTVPNGLTVNSAYTFDITKAYEF